VNDKINKLKESRFMSITLIQMALLLASGVCWRILKPAGLSAEHTRHVLTSFVYYLLMPAMILEVLWTAKLGINSIYYGFIGICSISIAMFCIWLTGILCRFESKRLGAILLAAVPNVTYLGLPVIEQMFGDWARSIVIQIDLFAVAPLVFTLGIAVARYYGEDRYTDKTPIWLFFNAPPFWAAGIAIILNKNNILAPAWFFGALKQLSAAVVPLMLFSLGLALSWQAVKVRNIPYLIPVIAVKMFLLPLMAYSLFSLVPSIDSQSKAVATLDLAMPCMVLGVVFCDRFRLDSALYAMTVTITTALSLITLPFWYTILTNGIFK
jgi:malate permease and related proteins